MPEQISLLPDCLVPGCGEPSVPGEPCADHQLVAAELFAWGFPNGPMKTITREEADRRRAARLREVLHA